LFLISVKCLVSPDVRDAYFGSLDKAFEGFTFVDDSAAQYMTRGAPRRYNPSVFGLFYCLLYFFSSCSHTQRSMSGSASTAAVLALKKN
jgi:hypothetical protein